MCEPKHSIVQYPDNNDDDQSSGMPTEQRISGWGEWLRKIGRWLHLSKMGNGHSEAIKATGLVGDVKFSREELFLPKPTYYEVEWWERKLLLDGPFRGSFERIGRNALDRSYMAFDERAAELRRALQQESKDAAQQYANAVSIGNMTTFRRFFTTSIAKSAEPRKYALHFELMLNAANLNFIAFWRYGPQKDAGISRHSLGHHESKRRASDQNSYVVHAKA